MQADLYAGAIFIDQALGLNLYIAIILLLIISGLFTILGGLTAVIWTDAIQTVLMVVGAVYLMISAFIHVGGFESMVTKYFNSIPNTTRVHQLTEATTDPNNLTLPSTVHDNYLKCGVPNEDAFHMFREVNDPNLPWTGVIFGLTISNIWYWCTDQVIVQRTLSAKNLTHAKGGCLLAGVLKLLPLWLLVFPGMIARILFVDEVGCADPDVCRQVCGKERGCTDIAYTRLVLRLLPSGARGLMLAVMIASLVSSLTSIFNSSSTLFTMDIWRRFRPRARSAELMVVGRVSTLALIGISVAWIPIVQSSGELFHYIQSVTSYLAPPVCGVFLLAVFWPRFNENGAFYALIVGLAVGIIRFVWEAVYSRLACGEVQEETIAQKMVTKLHYLHFGIILLFISCSVGVIVSLLTKPLPEKYTLGMTYWTRNYKPSEVKRTSEEVNDHQYGVEETEDPACIHAFVDVEPEESSTEATKTKYPWYKRVVYWICGIETSPTSENDTVIEELTLSIDEKPKWVLINEVAAVTLMVAVACLWGFFA
ncbi:Sodium/glucose cotransporter [Fasciola hepatica]|uniref:Sodium/glucose cotransporter n=1 Tax=Fasciola hepatica TaxID=6192 RepID=A0A4E0QXJ5_FASHE|nr:Sodium/glucose cotransporter [Fasciola hepatica]